MDGRVDAEGAEGRAMEDSDWQVGVNVGDVPGVLLLSTEGWEGCYGPAPLAADTPPI